MSAHAVTQQVTPQPAKGSFARRQSGARRNLSSFTGDACRARASPQDHTGARANVPAPKAPGDPGTLALRVSRSVGALPPGSDLIPTGREAPHGRSTPTGQRSKTQESWSTGEASQDVQCGQSRGTSLAPARPARALQARRAPRIRSR